MRERERMERRREKGEGVREGVRKRREGSRQGRRERKEERKGLVVTQADKKDHRTGEELLSSGCEEGICTEFFPATWLCPFSSPFKKQPKSIPSLGKAGLRE